MKLNYRRTFFIGLAFMSICAFWQLYDGIIPLILDNTFGIGETMTGVIMAIDNVLALFLLPIFGTFSDKTNTRLGKRTPYILFGTIGAVSLMMLLPMAANNRNFVLFFFSLGFLLIAMGTYRSPAVALMPDLTPKPLRSKANAVINLMGALGGVYALAMISLTVGEDGNYTLVFATVACLMIVSVFILLLTVKEKKIAETMPVACEEPVEEGAKGAEGNSKSKLSKPVRRSLIFLFSSVFLWFTAYNAVTTAYSRYVQNVWGKSGGSFANSALIGTIAAVLSYIPVGFLSSALGRKKVILGGVALMTLAYGISATFHSYTWMMSLMLICIGIGWAAINVNSYPMVVEMGRGSDIGKYTGLYYLFSMMAQTLTPILSGALIEKISYRILFPYAAVFSILAFVMMLFVRHGDSKPSKKTTIIENFDTPD